MSVKALREGILDITHKHNPVWLKHIRTLEMRIVFYRNWGVTERE